VIPIPLPTGPLAEWLANYAKQRKLAKGSPLLVLDFHPSSGWLEAPSPNSGQFLRLSNYGERRAIQIRLGVESILWTPTGGAATPNPVGVTPVLSRRENSHLQKDPFELAPRHAAWIALTRVLDNDRGAPSLVLMAGELPRWLATGEVTIDLRLTWEDPADPRFSASQLWRAVVVWDGKRLDRSGQISVSVEPADYA
jgi:hypothetical protein